MANGLTQEELANRCELTKGFISQVERDLTSPSIASLVDILECLGTNLREFLMRQKIKIVFQKTIFLSRKILKINVKSIGLFLMHKNNMEPILMILDEGGQSMIHDPHEGKNSDLCCQEPLSFILEIKVQGKKG